MNSFSLSLIKKFNRYFFLILLINLLVLTLSAQDNLTDKKENKPEYHHKLLTVSLYTGISAPLKGTDYWNGDWEPEYLLGGSIFTHINDYIMAGVRLNYNHWLDDEYSLTKKYPSETVWTTLSGHVNLIEIVPSFRIIMSDEYNKTYMFMQLGGGYYNMQGSYVIEGTIKMPDNTPAGYYYDTKTFNFNTAGFDLGLGIKSGLIEIMPMYNVMFTPKNPTHYFTLNFGVNF
jgi:hypothetical protein